MIKNYWVKPVLRPSYTVATWSFYKFTHFYRFQCSFDFQDIFNEPAYTTLLMYENDKNDLLHFQIMEFDLLPYDPKLIPKLHKKVDSYLPEGYAQVSWSDRSISRPVIGPVIVQGCSDTTDDLEIKIDKCNINYYFMGNNVKVRLYLDEFSLRHLRL